MSERKTIMRSEQLREREHSDREEGSEDVLSYSKMIADVESQEKNEESRPRDTHNKRGKSDSVNGYHVSGDHQRVVKLSGPTQPNFPYKLPLGEKLKKSEPIFSGAGNEGGSIQVYPSPPTSPKENRQFLERLKRRGSLKSQSRGNEERGSGAPKRLGEKIISSVLKKEESKENEGIAAIEEESFIVPEGDDGDSISHFEPVEFSESLELEGDSGQTAGGEAEYVILTRGIKPGRESKFQPNCKDEDVPIELTESVGQQSQNKRNSLGRASQRLQLEIQSQVRRKGPKMPPLATKGPQFLVKDTSLAVRQEGHPVNMVRSKIMPKASKQWQERETEGGHDKSGEVYSRMKMTYDPKLNESEFKAASQGGNFSEPNRRSSKGNHRHKSPNDFEDEAGSAQKHSEPQESKYSTKAILEKLTKLQNAMIMLQENSERTSEPSHKQVAGNLAGGSRLPAEQPQTELRQQQGESRQRRVSKRKIEVLNSMMPEEFLGQDLSSIEERSVCRQFQEGKDGPRVREEISLLRLKIRELELMQRGAQGQSPSSRHKVPRMLSLSRASSQPKGLLQQNGISINYQHFKIASRNPAKHVSEGILAESVSVLTEEDEEFGVLESRLNNFDQTLRPEDSQTKIAEMGIAVYELLGVAVQSYGAMDVRRVLGGVHFQLSRGPTITWDYCGRLFFGSPGESGGSGGLRREGRGVEIWAQKYIYEGDISNEVRSGFGAAVDLTSGQNYKGYWRNGRYEGRGRLCTSCRRYEGYFINGMQQGDGFQLFRNGDTYEGEYFEGKFHGRGRYFWEREKNAYEGQFRKGHLQGEGTWRGSKGDHYRGRYYKGMKHGHGVYTWPNGKVFEGQFEHGHRVSRKSQDLRVISPQRQITYDLDESSERLKASSGPNRSGRIKNFTIRNIQELSNDKASLFGPYIRI